MITLDLNFHRKARIWLSELPSARYIPTESIVQTVDVNTGVHLEQTKSAAVEFFVPSGGRIQYALLGSEFTPDNSMQIEILVDVSDDTSTLIEWSLVTDEVYIGLPHDYAISIRDSLCNASELSLLGSGSFHICCAAHSLTGSSRAIFRQLSIILVRLLAIETPSSEEELLKLLQF